METNVFNVLNVLQDVSNYSQRLTSWRCYQKAAAITRHKTLQTLKLYSGTIKTLLYKYMKCLNLNVFNVLYGFVLMFLRLSTSRYQFSLTS